MSQRMPSAISARMLALLAQLGRRARDDPRHEERAKGEAGGIRGERQRHPDREEERPDRRRHELVGEQEGALQAGVGDAEVVAGDESRQQRAAGGVGEGLRGAEDEQR